MDGIPGEGSASDRPRSWAEVDLDAFAANASEARRLAPGREMLAVLKADAYGHGALLVARAARAGGAQLLGVGDSTEALELRAAGVVSPILVLGALVGSEIPDVIRNDITPVVHSRGRLAELDAEARRLGRHVSVHLKVDSGMGRLGVRPERVIGLAAEIRQSEGLELRGLMSHLAGTGAAGMPANARQVEVFAEMIGVLRREGLLPPVVHLRNTAGLLDRGLELPGETLVRAGALLYGFDPASGRLPEGFRPVLSLRTQLCFLKDVEPEAAVGYGGTFRTRRNTRLGVIPLGYDDGVKRGLAGSGEVLVRGRRVPVVGHVSMDYTTLDITDVPGAAVGDTVTLIGEDRGERIRVEEVAARCGTIPYDVLCGLGRRVVRFPVRSGARAS